MLGKTIIGAVVINLSQIVGCSTDPSSHFSDKCMSLLESRLKVPSSLNVIDTTFSIAKLDPEIAAGERPEILTDAEYRRQYGEFAESAKAAIQTSLDFYEIKLKQATREPQYSHYAIIKYTAKNSFNADVIGTAVCELVKGSQSPLTIEDINNGQILLDGLSSFSYELGSDPYSYVLQQLNH